jgi:hypothetical protein
LGDRVRPPVLTLGIETADGYGVTDWVLNLRVAGRGELRRKGRTTAFTAIEVDGAERDRVIAAFHARTPKPFSRDFDQRPDAGEHPTFRMDAIE